MAREPVRGPGVGRPLGEPPQVEEDEARPMTDPTNVLTPRQTELVWNIARGMTLRQTSRNMFVSYSTAIELAYQSRERLDLPDNATLALLAVTAVLRGTVSVEGHVVSERQEP